MNRVCQNRVWIAWLAVILAAQTHSVGAASTKFVALDIYPPRIQLQHRDDFQNVIAVARRADGMTVDVTKLASWKLSSAQTKPPAAWLPGRLAPMHNGYALLTVEYADLRAIAEVEVENIDRQLESSFRHDVLPIFLRAGCNAGGCHGSSRGKDGFRLSLFGFDPAGDYLRLTRQQPSRRLNLALPEESLLLLKATGAVPHTGGRRFDREAVYYEKLREWIADGAKDDTQEAPTVDQLTLYPPMVVLATGRQRQKLVATATYSDGTTRDVTHLALFQSTNGSTAAVDSEGRITSDRRGEAFVMARFDTHTVGSHVIVLTEDQPFEPIDERPANYIDELIGKKLRTLRIKPSPLASDETFLRRVTLDIAGRLPTSEEHKAFLADKNSEKRAARIDKLLASPEFPKLWGLKWAELLLVRTAPNRVDTKPMFLYSSWLTDQIAQDRPLDEMVRELLTATGTTFDTPATNFYQIEPDAKKVAENVAQAFLGIRIQCAQCHNHPFDRWTMDDYYAFAAFFAQIGRKQGEDYREWLVFDRHGGEQRHPIDNRVMQPKLLGGRAPELKKTDRRVLVADWIVGPENPYFGVSVANRVWAHFFGIGIVEPVDDIRISNPPSNRALFEQLGKRFVDSDYDLRQLVRDICNSNAYQRAAETNASNAEDTSNFARAYPRRIPAEVLLDCITEVTGAPQKLPGLPLGARAIEIADGNASNYFLATFGRAKRETVCACESKTDPTLSQALHLLNGKTVHGKIARGGLIKKWIQGGMSSAAVLDEIYVRCLSRLPTDDERKALLASLPKSRRSVQALRDIFWAVLNTREFLFNH